MSARGRFFRSLVAGLFAGVFWVDTALAQDAGCRFEPVAGTARQILRCREGLTIIVEGGARFTLVDRDRNGNADAVRLRRKALLLDAPAGAVPGGFVVVTPQAIAAVRGTKWAVDVGQRQDVCFRPQRSRRRAKAGVPRRRGAGAGRRRRRRARNRTTDRQALARQARFSIDGPFRSVSLQ